MMIRDDAFHQLILQLTQKNQPTEVLKANLKGHHVNEAIPQPNKSHHHQPLQAVPALTERNQALDQMLLHSHQQAQPFLYLQLLVAPRSTHRHPIRTFLHCRIHHHRLRCIIPAVLLIHQTLFPFRWQTWLLRRWLL